MDEKKEKLEAVPNSLIFVSLASMYLDNGMVDEAIDLCKAGLNIEPENEEAHLILSKAEIEKGEKENAKKRLIELLERNPENTTAKEVLKKLETEISEQTSAPEMKVEDEKIVSEAKEEKEEKSETKVEFETLLMEKINKINQVEGIINCFFRLKDGRIIKTSQLVGNIDDVLPLLDSLLSSVKSTARELKMGKLKVILIEIDRGVFYIFEKEEYDCFLLSHNTGNFGLLKAILPRILAETST